VTGPFTITRLPQIVFGSGTIAQVPAIAASFGRRALLVTGARSFRESRHGEPLTEGLRARGIEWQSLAVSGEPSPALVDGAVREHGPRGVEVVIGIGGGSALDAAKAIAGLLRVGEPVKEFIEVVGAGRDYPGPPTPFIAVPTTAGTGSEAAKNAVLSEVGPGGFKRSFRHDDLVARVAVVDPDLLESCPRALIAADGMDALTQLLEAYVSPRASGFTDALAESGLIAARDGLLRWYEGTGDAAVARERMAYAALLSGITLAQAGLGAVHGLSAPLGGLFPIPHGVVCGTLVADATRINVAALRARAPRDVALTKLARARAILADAAGVGPPPADAPERLATLLADWSRRLDLPRLGAYGIGAGDVARIVAGSRGGSMKTNPIVLEDEEIATIVRARL